MKKIYTSFLTIFFLGIGFGSLVAQNGQIDSTYGNNGKQNYADFHPYLYYNEGITMLPQSENSYLLVGDIITKDAQDKMWLPVAKFSNDVLTQEILMPLSDVQENFNLKCAVPSASGFSFKFLVAGGRNGNLFIKQFDADGNAIDYFGNHSEVERDLGGNDYVSSISRLSDGTYVVFAKTGSKVVCLKLDEAGAWDNTFGVGGKLEFPSTVDFKVYSTVSPQNDIYFTTGIQKLRKINKTGVENSEFLFLANQYADMSVSSIQLMADGGVLLGGNELFSPKSLILLKLNPDGSPVTSFGNQGKTLINYQGNFNTINSVRIFKNRIYVVGGLDLDYYVAKVSMDGFLVSSFGVDGLVKIAYGNSITACLDIKLNNNGTALLLGVREGWLATARIKNGSLPTVSADISSEFVCPGDVFQLTATGADTYHWTGSDGFESFIANPSLSIPESFGGTEVLYIVTGENADGFSDVAETLVILKKDIALGYTEDLPCFGETTGHLVTIIKGINYDDNIQVNYNPGLATKVSEDNEKIVFSFNQANSPLELTFNDPMLRYCPQLLSVDFETHNEITASLEINSIDSTCIGVIDPIDETVVLTYLWTNGSTGKIASGLAAGQFEVTVTNTVTGCQATFGGECMPILNTNEVEIEGGSIYPNPVEQELNLILDNLISDGSYFSIIDIQGRVVLSSKLASSSNGKYTINVNDLSAGIYFVKVRSQNGSANIGKFVKMN